MGNDWMGDVATYLTAATGPIGAMILVHMMIWDGKFKIAPAWHRFGLAFLAVGMIGQSVRSWVSIMTGVSPTDAEMPWWVFKDLGIFVLAVSWLVLGVLAARRSR
jgi:hypothetical protein